MRVEPLTPGLWPALADLFRDGRDCSRCWCAYWRIGPAYRRKAPAQNEAAFRAVVDAGPPPGLLAFEGERAVGWCQLTPRDGLPWLEKTPTLARVDDAPAWCISCFYVRKGYRKKGVTAALIREAVKIARKAGTPALEAYPLDAGLTASASFTGYLSTFERLGFAEVARRAPPRPILRKRL